MREYTKQPVPPELLEKVLDAARWAPSGANSQPWRFVLVMDPIVIQVIRRMAPGFTFDAPVLIAVCWQRDEKYPGPAREQHVAANCYIAAQNIALSARALGLGTCMIASFAPSAIAEVLSLPNDVHPELLIALGYPGRISKGPSRLPLAQLTYLNRWGKAWLE